ncbi:MAG: hypothetical protein ACEQSB_03475, partial [Undibacterium sp.]
MKTRLFLSGLLLAVFSAAVAVPAQAQTVAALQASPNPSLAGSIWLVKVAGEPRTRTLIIAEEAPIAGGALLTARYGMSDEHQTPIAAAIRLVGNKRQLVLTTQAASEIVADEQSNGSFSGTFTPKKGGVKPVSIALASDEDLRIASAAKVLVADPLIPSGVSHWADKPKLFAGDSWRFEFANKRYAKPGCQYQLSIERITGSNVYARAA